MTAPMRYRIEKCAEDEDGEPPVWEISVIRDGKYTGGCLYPTGAEALAAYNDGASYRGTFVFQGRTDAQAE